MFGRRKPPKVTNVHFSPRLDREGNTQVWMTLRVEGRDRVTVLMTQERFYAFAREVNTTLTAISPEDITHAQQTAQWMGMRQDT